MSKWYDKLINYSIFDVILLKHGYWAQIIQSEFSH
jgi:hypothetical protein